MADWTGFLLTLLLGSTLLALAYAAMRQRGGLRLIPGRPASALRGRMQADLTWLGTYTQAYQRALDVLELLDARLLSADPDRGTMAARTEPTGGAPPLMPVSLQILLTTRQGVTLVHIEAAPAIPLFPASARRVLEEFLRTWDRMPGPVRAETG